MLVKKTKFLFIGFLFVFLFYCVPNVFAFPKSVLFEKYGSSFEEGLDESIAQEFTDKVVNPTWQNLVKQIAISPSILELTVEKSEIFSALLSDTNDIYFKIVANFKNDPKKACEEIHKFLLSKLLDQVGISNLASVPFTVTVDSWEFLYTTYLTTRAMSAYSSYMIERLKNRKSWSREQARVFFDRYVYPSGYEDNNYKGLLMQDNMLILINDYAKSTKQEFVDFPLMEKVAKSRNESVNLVMNKNKKVLKDLFDELELIEYSYFRTKIEKREKEFLEEFKKLGERLKSAVEFVKNKTQDLTHFGNSQLDKELLSRMAINYIATYEDDPKKFNDLLRQAYELDKKYAKQEEVGNLLKENNLDKLYADENINVNDIVAVIKKYEQELNYTYDLMMQTSMITKSDIEGFKSIAAKFLKIYWDDKKAQALAEQKVAGTKNSDIGDWVTVIGCRYLEKPGALITPAVVIWEVVKDSKGNILYDSDNQPKKIEKVIKAAVYASPEKVLTCSRVLAPKTNTRTIVNDTNPGGGVSPRFVVIPGVEEVIAGMRKSGDTQISVLDGLSNSPGKDMSAVTFAYQSLEKTYEYLLSKLLNARAEKIINIKVKIDNIASKVKDVAKAAKIDTYFNLTGDQITLKDTCFIDNVKLSVVLPEFTTKQSVTSLVNRMSVAADTATMKEFKLAFTQKADKSIFEDADPEILFSQLDELNNTLSVAEKLTKDFNYIVKGKLKIDYLAELENAIASILMDVSICEGQKIVLTHDNQYPIKLERSDAVLLNDGTKTSGYVPYSFENAVARNVLDPNVVESIKVLISLYDEIALFKKSIGVYVVLNDVTAFYCESIEKYKKAINQVMNLRKEVLQKFSIWLTAVTGYPELKSSYEKLNSIQDDLVEKKNNLLSLLKEARVVQAGEDSNSDFGAKDLIEDEVFNRIEKAFAEFNEAFTLYKVKAPELKALINLRKEGFRQLLLETVRYNPRPKDLIKLITENSLLEDFKVHPNYKIDDLKRDVSKYYILEDFKKSEAECFDLMKMYEKIIAQQENLKSGNSSQQDVTEINKQVEKVIQDMYIAYENEDPRGFLRYVSPVFTSNNRTSQSFSQLEQAIIDDFRNLKNIRFVIYIHGQPLHYKDRKLVALTITWNRSADIEKTAQEWVVNGKSSTFVFEILDTGEIVLIKVQGDLPFGLANPYGVITVSDGKIDRVEVTDTKELKDGKITESQQIYTDGATSDINIVNESWYFSTRNTGLYALGDIYYTSDAGDGKSYIGISDDADRIKRITGYSSLSEVTSVPSGGYVAFYANPAVGDIYAILSKTGKYAIIEITGFGSEMRFDYKYPLDA